MVDNIIIEISKDERIATPYNVWYEKREEVLKIYSDDLPKCVLLVDNDDFKPKKIMLSKKLSKYNQTVSMIETLMSIQIHSCSI